MKNLFEKLLATTKKTLRYSLRKLKFIQPKNKTVSIISDNCMAGSIYKIMNAPFNSPTIGLFIPGPDFVRFCRKLESYLQKEPRELKESKYSGKVDYPLGLLGDVELHFLHYGSFDDAKKAWVKRSERVDIQNIFFTMTDRDWTSTNDRDEFLGLDLENKLYFCSDNYKHRNAIWCWRYKHLKEIGLVTTVLEFTDYFNVSDWLDKKQVVKKY